MKSSLLTSYDRDQSYQWNYDHVPERSDAAIPRVAGDWQFCGHPVGSPLGIPAGPLLNGRWCIYYASLGFDVLTYKTVRSSQRDCYAMPNLQPVQCGQLNGKQEHVAPVDSMQGTWAVAFGMPSSAPEVWRRDIEWTRDELPDAKVLCVSVVGTMQEGWGIHELAADYAKCAQWAIESGADCIETNFSCPNVNTCDGQLYLDEQQSAIVSEAVKSAIGSCPLIIKVGHFMDTQKIPPFLSAVNQYADAVSMTNSIACKVGKSKSRMMFDSQPRGICGRGIRDASIGQVGEFSKSIRDLESRMQIIGLGGIETAADVKNYLKAGATSCQIASHAMVDPGCGIRIRRELAAEKQ